MQGEAENGFAQMYFVSDIKCSLQGLPDGRGYQGSRIFRAKANDHVLGGDFENDDGTGGHSAYEEKYFLAEQCPLKDQKGAIRMKGLERTIDGRCRVGSQFMIWVGDLEYKVADKTSYFFKIQFIMIYLRNIGSHWYSEKLLRASKSCKKSQESRLSRSLPLPGC